MYNTALGKVVQTRNYSVNKKGEIIDGIVNVQEKYVQSTDLLKHALAVLKPDTYGKRALNGDKEDEKDKTVIFSSEEDL